MPAEINIYNPSELGPPMGQYSHVTRVKANEFLFIAGMLSGDAAGNIVGADDFDTQTTQVFRNVEAALKSAGASWRNVVQFTTFLVHSQDIPKFMAFRLREFPKMFPDGKYPPNTLLMVDRLVQEPFLVEVQTVAAI
ncbi:MAG: RidA family protein [Bradyrhizobium sp.]|jgi:enamine deaminase RidA (YjgF/YER057c/UK114 family)|uniref:RidA family protein n=1 Tax=Bradyrhizobium sp. TaxID=376 RepID=UPI001213B908|nr:RidA family protein [Bradyrhizobium sp.]THD55246.1 MAG: RidA family protein [Bradyrhizobium sp.]